MTFSHSLFASQLFLNCFWLVVSSKLFYLVWLTYLAFSLLLYTFIHIIFTYKKKLQNLGIVLELLLEMYKWTVVKLLLNGCNLQINKDQISCNLTLKCRIISNTVFSIVKLHLFESLIQHLKNMKINRSTSRCGRGKCPNCKAEYFKRSKPQNCTMYGFHIGGTFEPGRKKAKIFHGKGNERR